jgi:hypothetical protein
LWRVSAASRETDAPRSQESDPKARLSAAELGKYAARRRSSFDAFATASPSTALRDEQLHAVVAVKVPRSSGARAVLEALGPPRRQVAI